MANRSTRRRAWSMILRATGVGGLFVWFGFIAVFEHFDSTRPIKPDVERGRVIPQNNHGHIVYLTEQEQKQLLVLQRASIGLFLVATVAAYFYKREAGGAPLTQ